MKFYLLASIILLSVISSVQANVLNKKGKWSFYYGYNRATYSESDYHFTGDGYDFTLENVQAQDTPTPFAIDPYLLPWGLSVPQNNTRFSYYLTDTFALSFGSDHMKYRMNDYQNVGFTGTIETGEGFDRSGSGTQAIDPSFLTFEHTDGLNYVSFEFEHFKPLWSNDKKTQAFSVYWGPGLGVMFPKTNSQLFGRARNDKFHIAGYGASIKFGAEYLFNDWFIRTVVKYGYVDMNDARSTQSSADKVSHQFNFTESFVVFGLYY